MRYPLSKGPWSILTVLSISIIFTPIVGGILAGLNQISLGFERKAWREFLLSLFAFIWYFIYFSDFSVALFRSDFMLFSEKNRMKAHKNQ
jgi:hypothetical protein